MTTPAHPHPVPLVSVGLPVYNGEAYLSEALDSLLAQTEPRFEIIVSDNGSSDATPEICRAYAKRDGRVHYYRAESNRGAAWNHNRVVELARAPYFKWAAHDDRCAPEFLQRCVAVLESRPEVVLSYPQATLIDARGLTLRVCDDPVALDSPSPAARFIHLLRRVGLSNPMYGVARLAVLRRTPLLAAYPGADLVLLGELALRGVLHQIPETLFFRREHPGRSARAHATAHELNTWYAPRGRRAALPVGRRLLGHVASVLRVPISPAERVRCLVFLVRWARWNAAHLRRELVGLLSALRESPAARTVAQ